MRKVVFLLAIALTASLTQVQAQAPKLGYINSQELISLMPGAAKADSVLAKYMRKLDNEYKAVAQEAQQKYQEYQSQKANWKPAILETKEKELSDLQTRLQELQMNAQDSIQAKRSELFEPLLNKAQDAIKAVGKEGGYNYIFDGSALLYANDAENLMSKVKAKLGIK